MYKLESLFGGTVQLALPLQQNRTWIQELSIIVGASLLVGLFAKVQIPLPFTPVPIVLQDTMIIFLGVLLGSRRGAAAAFAFLAQGAAGWPVFAGGVGGFVKFAGPTGGYLIGYLFAAFAAGWIVERLGKERASSSFLGMLGGSAVLFLCGVSFLSSFVGVKSALLLGLLPFIPGNLVKTIVVVCFYRFLIDRRQDAV
jgi:biotin transport system substrate-specific component